MTWLAHAAEAYGLEIVEPAEMLRTGSDSIVKIKSTQGVFVLKGIPEECKYGFRHLNAKKMEIQGKWSEAMAEEGLPVVRRLRSCSGQYSAVLDNGQRRWLTTLEQYAAGDEFTCRDLNDVHLIGMLLGQLHRVSLETEIFFGHGTSWSLFGGNATEELGDYDENEKSFTAMIGALKRAECPAELLERIKKLYHARRAEVQNIWMELPAAAVQGDLCPYNMTRGKRGEIAGLFDLNLAGDEVLVGELCALLAYYASYPPPDSPSDKVMHELFQAYVSERPLKKEELSVVEPLMRLLPPFRFDRVARLNREIEVGGKTAVIRAAEETIALLEQSYSSILQLS